ncbi:MAG: hypothetical protein EAX86_03085 [Candidatus Heimdallarchaeota archaeon]|nr:hypothetical protein [Candidatus Heimdallarchaeota archaeon]
MTEIKSFKLEVNGKKISAKRFVQEFIGNSLLGQIQTLRLKDPTIERIYVEIEFGEAAIREKE